MFYVNLKDTTFEGMNLLFIIGDNNFKHSDGMLLVNCIAITKIYRHMSNRERSSLLVDNCEYARHNHLGVNGFQNKYSRFPNLTIT